ncbi:MAG: alanine--tRNA ligase [Bacilli bacterium]|nr:alanine--tRNA ligase [Bacilli bacterium]
MRKLSGREIRQVWIKFFQSKGHVYIPGVPLIPQGDKSLLWVNAGVTGLKKYFDGSEIPPSRRIVNVQKSIRTNDIENVGHTARHHTFFEMLGNFSIGDYFRDEVIPWAAEILTSEEVGFGIPFEKLYITYSPLDKATHDLWVKCGVPEDHLIPLEGNFWEIGEGPCGPDTEMFFDRGEAYDPEGRGVELLRKEIENDRYIEIWNIVFSQFNSVAGVKREDYKELPSKNIDTGSGLERIACILQGTETNFETDLFTPIIKETEQLCGQSYQGENKMAFRVIADHARCLTFALSDGASFSNEGRGYVLRRIIRRAMRYGKKLGIDHPFMYGLVDTVIAEYKDFYPDLEGRRDYIVKSIENEERKFLKTLVSGEALLREKIEDKDTLSGADAFLLYDTFGFPFDLTNEICAEAGVKVDEAGFRACMEEQKQRARSARSEVASFHKQSKDLLAFQETSEFDYGTLSTKGKVIGLFVDGVATEEIDEEGDVVFDVTPFYSESGGQVSDEGSIENQNASGRVVAMGKTPNGAHLHHVQLAYGTIRKGDEFTLQVDAKKRRLTARNHSATHLLHAAIGEVLGHHVDQKGSFVNEEYLRFDYEAEPRPSQEQLQAIEKMVNAKIEEAIEEKTLVLPIEEAAKLGAEMEFSEKYGDLVRVVTFGDFSKEFCGGTHVANSSDIGIFVLTSDSAVSSGVRRIEGRTSLGAYQYLARKREALDQLGETLGNPGDALIIKKVDGLREELNAANKEIDRLKAKLASSLASSLTSEFEEIDGVHFFATQIEGGREEAGKLGDSMKTKFADYLIFIAAKGEKGIALSAFAGGKGERLGAGSAMKLVGPLYQGNGGGKPSFASGSGKALADIEAVKSALREALKA